MKSTLLGVAVGYGRTVMLSAGMGCGRIFDHCQAAVAVCASLVLSSFLGNACEKSGDVSSGQDGDGLCVELAARSSSWAGCSVDGSGGVGCDLCFTSWQVHHAGL